MVPVALQPTRIATTDHAKPEDGLLILAAGALVAVVSQLDGSVGADENLRGQWFLEAGFGPCAVHPSDECIFGSLEEAQEWVLGRLSKTK